MNHDSIKQHEGRKYLRSIYPAADADPSKSIDVDIYCVLQAFGVTCPATQHAIKKLLAAGMRLKGTRLEDLVGAMAALHRAIDLEKLALARLTLEEPGVVQCRVAAGEEVRAGDPVYRDSIGEVLARKEKEWKDKGILDKEEKELEADPRWIVIPVHDGSITSTVVGYRVAWSKRDAKDRMLMVRHYLTDGVPGSPSISWCQYAAERDAARFNEQGKRPEEYQFQPLTDPK